MSIRLLKPKNVVPMTSSLSYRRDLFVTSAYLKKLLFMPDKQHFTSTFNIFSSSTHNEPSFPDSESFPTILNDVKLLVESLLMQVQVPPAIDMNFLPIILRYVLCLWRQTHRS
ncbi:hypothetical protein TNCV_3331691 [Trichonephila clavipes]|nr:hypothetical protein TNCV_3331691 [Trichonephila clavipes]